MLNTEQFFEFLKPEGYAVVKRDIVIAISESSHIGVGCLIHISPVENHAFNCTEDYPTVVARFSNVATQ